MSDHPIEANALEALIAGWHCALAHVAATPSRTDERPTDFDLIWRESLQLRRDEVDSDEAEPAARRALLA